MAISFVFDGDDFRLKFFDLPGEFRRVLARAERDDAKLRFAQRFDDLQSVTAD